MSVIKMVNINYLITFMQNLKLFINFVMNIMFNFLLHNYIFLLSNSSLEKNLITSCLTLQYLQKFHLC